MSSIKNTFTLSSPENPDIDRWLYPKALVLSRTHYSSTHTRLYVELCTHQENMLTWFAQNYFEGLDPRLMHYCSEDGRVIVVDNFFQSITIDGKNARDAIDRLFREKLICAEVRSSIEPRLKSLELCLENSQRINDEITPAQQSTLEFFAEAYAEVLKENFQGWELDAALNAACKNCSLDEQDFHSAMENQHISNSDEECIPILDDDWNETKKREITGAFYMISRLLLGLADLEGVLLKQGPSLPSLDVQRRIIFALLK
ncbi:MAG: hypothetical protein LLF94_05855 [Chlamydiales bacterium]|nr:hypothetical protein [Chlamydiales bacterium]